MERCARRAFAVLLLITVAAGWPPAAGAATPERTAVATLRYEVGQAVLTDSQRAVLDDLLARYPIDRYIYSFEGDHDELPFMSLTPNGSRRVNERLAETRWQNIAHYLGVRPYGIVRSTGRAEVRVYVEERRSVASDSLEMLRREIDDLRRRLGQAGAPPSGAPTPARAAAPAETVLAVARLEKLYERSDKWVDRRWWEAQGGIELGILRVTPERASGRRSGAMMRIAGGTPAHQPFEITTRLDLFRLGTERIGITPALRWYDWYVRLHYGDDREALTSFINRSDPVYLFGLDLDAKPWNGAWLQLEYAGIGSRVHAAHRDLESYDHFDLQFEQRLAGRLRLELQAIYDERFEKSVPYLGGWLAYAWPMRLGEFVTSLGYVNQLDALQATTGRRREDLISTISMGLTWRRMRH
jgi:hypothetical protein